MPLQVLTEEEIITELLDAAGWSTTARTIDDSNPQTYNFWLKEGQTILQGIYTLQDMTGGMFYIDEQGNATWESRNFRTINSNSINSQFTFTETMSKLDYDLTEREIYNHVRVAWTPKEAAGDEGGGGGSDITVKYTYTPYFRMYYGIKNVHRFHTLNGDEAASWGLPTAEVLRSLIDVTSQMIIYKESESPTSCLVAYQNNSYDGYPAAYIYYLQVTYTPLQEPEDGGIYESESEVEVEDADSITAYGRRTKYVRVPYPMEREEALSLANFYLAYYKAPVAIMKLTVYNRTQAILDEQLGLRLSERITVTNADLSVNADFYINSAQHTVSEDKYLHETVFIIEKVKDARQVWALDVGALDTTTGLGA